MQEFLVAEGILRGSDSFFLVLQWMCRDLIWQRWGLLVVGWNLFGIVGTAFGIVGSFILQ